MQSGIIFIVMYFEFLIVVMNVGGLLELVKDGVNGFIVQLNVDFIVVGLEDYFDCGRKVVFLEKFWVEKEEYFWKVFVEKIF